MRKDKEAFTLIMILLLLISGCVGQPIKTAVVSKKTDLPSSTKPPSLEITEPQPGFETDQNQVEVKGKTDPGCMIKVDGVQTGVQPDGSFSFGVQLVKGMNMFTVTAISKKGASQDKELSVNCTADRVIDLASSAQELRPRDISTPAKALIGHWRLDETPAGGDISHWYFDGNKMTIYIETRNITLRPEPYTVVLEDLDWFSVIIDFGDDETLTARFLEDGNKAMFNYSAQKPFPIYFVDMKTEP
jgi:hypothetical protein